MKKKWFNIEGLSNTYGDVSGHEEDGKYYLLLDDYSSCAKVEITKEAFDELYNQFGDNDAFKLKDLQDNCNHINIDYLKTYTSNNKDFWSDLICTDCGKNMGINYRVYWKMDDDEEK